jgi:hypothetical protein
VARAYIPWRPKSRDVLAWSLLLASTLGLAWLFQTVTVSALDGPVTTASSAVQLSTATAALADGDDVRARFYANPGSHPGLGSGSHGAPWKVITIAGRDAVTGERVQVECAAIADPVASDVWVLDLRDFSAVVSGLCISPPRLGATSASHIPGG